jgi:hemin uptake protein HemP
MRVELRSDAIDAKSGSVAERSACLIIVSAVPREHRRSAAAERGPLDDVTSQPFTAVRRVSSVELLGPKGELIIEHEGREYRLRLTQNGKLILTA